MYELTAVKLIIQQTLLQNDVRDKKLLVKLFQTLKCIAILSKVIDHHVLRHEVTVH